MKDKRSLTGAYAAVVHVTTVELHPTAKHATVLARNEILMLDIMYLTKHVVFQYEHRLNLQLSIIDMGQSFRPPLQDIIAQDDASKHRPTRESHIDCVSRHFASRWPLEQLYAP